jgi:antitoxin HicB
MYTVTLTPDDNGTVLVACPDLPEVTTFGDDEEDAIGRAADAIEEALAARIARREDIPIPAVVPHRTMRGAVAAQTPTLRQVEFEGCAMLYRAPSEAEPNLRIVRLPPLTVAKVGLYRALRAAGVSKAELGRRLGWHGPQVDRLLDLNHRSTIAHLDQALRAIGKRLEVKVEDAA